MAQPGKSFGGRTGFGPGMGMYMLQHIVCLFIHTKLLKSSGVTDDNLQEDAIEGGMIGGGLYDNS